MSFSDFFFFFPLDDCLDASDIYIKKKKLKGIHNAKAYDNNNNNKCYY